MPQPLIPPDASPYERLMNAAKEMRAIARGVKADKPKPKVDNRRKRGKK